MPIPNAMVATMTTPSSRRNVAWFAERISDVKTRVVRQGRDALAYQNSSAVFSTDARDRQ